MSEQQRIEEFLSGSPHAVVGASRDRSKYGNKVFRVYLQNGRPVFPVNPNAQTIEGQAAYADLSSLPSNVHGISVITQPEVTEQIIEQAAELGIKHVWLQPGAESRGAMERAEQLGLSLIAGGPCVLVVMGYRENA